MATTGHRRHKMEDDFPFTHLMNQVRDSDGVVGYCDHVFVRTIDIAGTLGHDLLHWRANTLGDIIFGPNQL